MYETHKEQEENEWETNAKWTGRGRKIDEGKIKLKLKEKWTVV